MSDHRSFCQFTILLKEGIHDLIVFPHRIIEPLREVEREDSGLLDLVAHLVDQAVQPFVSRNLGYEAMKAAVSLKVTLQIFFLIGFPEELMQFPETRDLFSLSPFHGEPRGPSLQNTQNGVVVLHVFYRRLADHDLAIGEKG